MFVLPVLPAALRSSAPHTARMWHHLVLRHTRRVATALAVVGVLAACSQQSSPASGQGSDPSTGQASAALVFKNHLHRLRMPSHIHSPIPISKISDRTGMGNQGAISAVHKVGVVTLPTQSQSL